MAETTTMPLTTPIQAHGETLSALELRCPTVKELRACGAPYRLGANAGGFGGVAVDYDACARLISSICAIPPSSVDQMDAGDFDEAAWRLVGFMRRSSDGETVTAAAPAPSIGS